MKPKKILFADGAANPGYDETGEMNEMDRVPSSSSRRGSEDINNPYHHRKYEETSFGGDISDITPLIERENELNDSVVEIKRTISECGYIKIHI